MWHFVMQLHDTCVFLHTSEYKLFPLLCSFVRSLGVAVGRWQFFDVPSAYRQRWGLGLAQFAIPL